MKKNAVPVFLLAIVGITAPAVNASIERSTDEQVKSLAQRYAQVEGQLDRSVHYTKKEGAGPRDHKLGTCAAICNILLTLQSRGLANSNAICNRCGDNASKASDDCSRSFQNFAA
jgi:hypothetical protein